MPKVLSLQITAARIHWVCLGGSHDQPHLIDLAIENPLKLPRGETDGAQLVRLEDELKTLVQAAEPNCIVSMKYTTMRPALADCMSVGQFRALVLTTASRAGKRFEETTPAQANKTLRKTKFDRAELIAHIHATFPDVTDQQAITIACAWAWLKEAQRA